MVEIEHISEVIIKLKDTSKAERAMVKNVMLKNYTDLLDEIEDKADYASVKGYWVDFIPSSKTILSPEEFIRIYGNDKQKIKFKVMTFDELRNINGPEPDMDLLNKALSECEGIMAFYRKSFKEDGKRYWLGKLGSQTNQRNKILDRIKWIEETKRMDMLDKGKKTFDTDYGVIIAEDITSKLEDTDLDVKGIRLTGDDLPEVIEIDGMVVAALDEVKIIKIINYYLGLE